MWALPASDRVTDDGGADVPHHVDAPHGEHGRGLSIVSVLARSWGFEQLDGGRLRVWFEVPCTGGPAPLWSPSRDDGTRAEAPTPSPGAVHGADPR